MEISYVRDPFDKKVTHRRRKINLRLDFSGHMR